MHKAGKRRLKLSIWRRKLGSNAENNKHKQEGERSKSKNACRSWGAGFLGSHLCERFLAEGCDVLCVDNFYTGTKRTSPIFLLALTLN